MTFTSPHARTRPTVPPRRWTDQDSQALRRLHSEGRSLHSIAAELGWSKQTVSRHAADLGLAWDRAQTALAANAVRVDNQARRAALEERYLVEADRMLDQLWKPAVVFNIGGSENVYTEAWLDKPTFADQKAIIQASASSSAAANKLHDLNSVREADGVKATLTRLREALTDRARDSADQ